jgi:hypothetical protein
VCVKVNTPHCTNKRCHGPLLLVRSDPGAEGGEGGETYHLWSGSLLPDELDAKLNLGDQPAHAAGPSSAPPSVVGSASPAPPPSQAATQQPPDLASLWGNAQVGTRDACQAEYAHGLSCQLCMGCCYQHLMRQGVYYRKFM